MLLVRIRGGCECWVSLVLISRILLSGLRSVVLLILQVSYLRGKVLEHIMHVGIFFSFLGWLLHVLVHLSGCCGFLVFVVSGRCGGVG